MKIKLRHVSCPEPLFEVVSLDEVLEAGLTSREDAAVARVEEEGLFLRRCIFRDLTMLNPSWDSEQICHFHANDFLTVLERCSKAGVQVFGVEVFTAEGEFLEVNIPVGDADLPHFAFVQRLSSNHGLSFCATYGFDDVSLLDCFGSKAN